MHVIYIVFNLYREESQIFAWILEFKSYFICISFLCFVTNYHKCVALNHTHLLSQFLWIESPGMV